jgi:hypothetical protein
MLNATCPLGWRSAFSAYVPKTCVAGCATPTDGNHAPEAFQKIVTSPGWLPNRVYTAETKANGVIVASDRTHNTMMLLPTTLRSVNQVFLNIK